MIVFQLVCTKSALIVQTIVAAHNNSHILVTTHERTTPKTWVTTYNIDGFSQYNRHGSIVVQAIICGESDLNDASSVTKRSQFVNITLYTLYTFLSSTTAPLRHCPSPAYGVS